MKTSNHVEIARLVVKHMVMAPDPCDGMADVIRALVEDDEINGQDMVKILSGALVYMARTLDTAAAESVGALLPLLVLLYPDKPMGELMTVAAAILRRDEPDAGPVTRFVFVSKRHD
jgi:hypothetical protein